MRKRKKNLFTILVLLLLGIGLGYALLSQDLTINGITKVKGNEWSIHFDNVQISSGSVTLSTGDSAATINSNDDTLVEYTVTLNTPGDFYEFTVDAVNDGTVDGMIGEVINKLNGTVISTTNPLPVYLDYTFSYADGTSVAPNHLLEAGDTETYKVRVEFKRDIENSELPTTDQTNSFSFGISYLQRTSAAIAVPHPTTSTVYTINIYDEEHEEDTGIWIGQPIPAAITQYSSAAEAMAALNTLAGGTVEKPIYFKHTVSNNTVTESYIEFVITPEMATVNPTMTAGTYTLQGEAMCTYNSVNDDWDCSEEDSQYYASNITTLQTAFGTSNCDDYYPISYRCSVGGLNARASSSGLVNVIDDSFSCYVFEEGSSGCEGVPDVVPFSGIVYMVNSVPIGVPIPNNLTQYATAAEAMEALKLKFESSDDIPFCLKNEVIYGIVTASYVEFIVTSEMATVNPTMTAGTYALKGGDHGDAYNTNKTALQTAFGASHCTDNTTSYRCSVGDLNAYADSGGNVNVYVGNFNCNVEDGGNSYCVDGVGPN